MALALGHCDWLVLLLLWGGATEPDRRPPPVAGHRAGRHRTFLAGEAQIPDTRVAPIVAHSRRVFNTFYISPGLWSRQG